MIGYYAIGGFIVGFILGALIYRNNAKNIERDLNKAKEDADRLRRQLLKR